MRARTPCRSPPRSRRRRRFFGSPPRSQPRCSRTKTANMCSARRSIPINMAFAAFLAENAKAKLALEPKDVKVAIVHEDGPYGVGVAQASEQFSKERGLQIVLREGYSASAPDLSSLVTKLKRAGA